MSETPDGKIIRGTTIATSQAIRKPFHRPDIASGQLAYRQADGDQDI